MNNARKTAQLAKFWAAVVGIGIVCILLGVSINSLIPQFGHWLGACFLIAVFAIPGWFLVAHLHEVMLEEGNTDKEEPDSVI